MTERKRQMRLKRRERRRARYKRRVTINVVAIALVALVIAGLYIANDRITEATYIEYSESAGVKYSVKIPKDAPFYSQYLESFSQYADENGDLWIPTDHAYPTMAATLVRITFNYQLEVCSPDVDYEYTYRIVAQPEVVDGATKNKFPLPKTVIEQSDEPIKGVAGSKVDFNKNIEIDYHYYNNIVKSFEEQLEIRNATENLIITMEVEVIGSSEKFENNAENTCVIKVTMPLNENAFDVNYSTSSNHCGDCKILCDTADGVKGQLVDIANTLVKVEIALVAILLIGLYISKNKDITYYNKVQRLVNSYRSFIQKVENGFDTTGYQIVVIASFREMLAIRDTIQSPILMSENTDKTKCQFFIPTNTKILYLFEVKVDDYDKLYAENPKDGDNSAIKDAEVAKASSESAGRDQAAPIKKNDRAERREVTKPARKEKVRKTKEAPKNSVDTTVNSSAPATGGRLVSCGCASATITVDGHMVTTTTNIGCTPYRANVNVNIGDCNGSCANKSKK